MYQETANDERRLFKRYFMESPVLITGDSLVGLIRDLSCGGCSFRYVRKKTDLSQAVKGDYELSLDPLGLAQVKVRTVEDLPEFDKVTSLAGTMHVRRVKFIGLSLLQLRRVQEYIRKNCKEADDEQAGLSGEALLAAPRTKASLLQINPGC